jgi:hypothetical protein
MKRKCFPFEWLLPGLIFGLALISSATRAAEVTSSDLEAAIRTLGFLETLHRDSAVNLGVVYAPDSATAKAQAASVATRISALPGPNKSVLRATPVATEALAQAADQLDVIYLMPGASAEAATIIEAARRRHLVTISNDPTCLDQKCCVLMIRTGRGVEIILQTSLADAVGARFSAVFSMMVKRQ